ncbi:protein spitz-like isoform X2 [Rhodnius prolixus]|uniref:protein spitz-like isoform X2 n=1 Tax=Rhodnius prolixus TaxID=13249 RepID=UPI003D18E2B1
MHRRRRGVAMRLCSMQMTFASLLSLLILQNYTPLVETCSSRSTPKPRPPGLATSRPNVTFHTYGCPTQYDKYYCLNGATCFTVKIGETHLYNCECADGFIGERCEFKDLEGSYMPSKHRVMLETASIASGATIAVFLVVVICMFIYVRIQRRHKQNLVISNGESSGDLEKRVPTGRREQTRISLHHITVERSGGSDSLSSAVYTGQTLLEPP